MSQASTRSSLSAYLLIGLSLLLGIADLFTAGTFICGWIGGVQILNSVASRLPFPRVIHWVYAMTFESLAIACVGVLRFMPRKDKLPGEGRPILLIHGYINDGSVWSLLKKRLKKLGLGPIYTIDLGHPFKPLRTYAEKVKEKVEQIKQETGRDDLSLIGHSMGGIVSCLYAVELAPSNTITDIITIGSPFAGTLMAHLAIGENAREMRPHSPLLKGLHQKILENTQIQFYHIASRTDQLVIPGGSAIVDKHPHFMFEDLGHAALLYSRRVTHKIADHLLSRK